MRGRAFHGVRGVASGAFVAACVLAAACTTPAAREAPTASGAVRPPTAVATSITPTAAPPPAAAATASGPPSASASAAPSAAASPAPTRPSGVPGGAEPATVARVVDGDTIDVTLAGAVARVRLILVDTPEVYGTVGCFGAEASAFTKATAPPGTPVFLERDVSETDRYGRLLRYVYLPGGVMLNELLAREGYARLATFPPDVKYLDRIAAAQDAARAEGAGLWSACAGDATASSATSVPTVAATTATTATTAAGACDPSYPDVCIPPPPPDLDCSDIPYRDFRVVGADPHHFDGNHDGIGCTSN